jgi:UDP-N-acetylglucosamine 2-epimerase (non-hydrolysing)
MSKRIKLLLVAGARPNFMKVAPLIKCIERQNRGQEGNHLPIEFCLVHTGQHYDARMSSVFFADLGIPAPDVNLEVGSGSHAVQTANVMIRFEPVCLREKPDWVVVVGDINSTMACSLVASKLGIKVAHVEAGLRSFDRTMPEEINRIVTDAVSDLLFTPSQEADENLKREGIPADRIRFVGNIMIDCLLANLDKARQSSILKSLEVQTGGFAYVTLHRPSNVDDPVTLKQILRELVRVAERLPVIFPMHPRTRSRIREFAMECENGAELKVIDPVGYHDSLALTENARLVLTDSGGLQEEATYFRTPCLTLRPNTERPVTVVLGSNRLTNVQRLQVDIHEALQRSANTGTVPPLWDGDTASRILYSLSHVRI